MIHSVIEGRKGSLSWKISLTFSSLMVVVGLLVLGTVYSFLGGAIRIQLEKRAQAIATNLSDVVAGPMAVKNNMETHAQVAKYALLEGTAYAFIEDGQGEIVAHSVGGVFPAELRERLSPTERRRLNQRSLTFRGKVVYETRIPVLEGRVGAVHVGLWGDAVEEEVRRVLFPGVWIIAGVVICGVLLSLLLAQGMIRPIKRLTATAEKISKGDLDAPLDVDSGGEIGDLARSLERMRASLKVATNLLGRG